MSLGQDEVSIFVAISFMLDGRSSNAVNGGSWVTFLYYFHHLHGKEVRVEENLHFILHDSYAIV